mmetsp:Transcript_1435/g.3244  ORF Transcript_1435/g.3244 Transcript_1435/m.3244 type:complete len:500 (-) Transcript_1435:183-1682(-)
MAALQDRLLVEMWATQVAMSLGHEVIVALLVPWSQRTTPPQGLLVPSPQPGGCLLNSDEIVQMTATKNTVLVPCCFIDPEEEAATQKILPQLAQCEHICVFIVHLLGDVTPNRAQNEVIMRRHEAMFATGVDDVLMDMGSNNPDSIMSAIAMARANWELNVQRMQLMMDAEPQPMAPEAMRELRSQHARLLWESIPRALMPRFKPIDRRLVETGDTVDKYRLIRSFDTKHGNVLQAVDDTNHSVVLKVIDKSKVCTPGELEGIYRELRFLSEIIRHPNVVRCHGMLQSATRVYFIFEYAGNQNLAQLTQSRPGQRLDSDEALAVFNQVAKGLHHCHTLDVSLRNVALEHVVVSQMAGSSSPMSRFATKLVDFHCAMIARGSTVTRTICGVLPCIAPEMAIGSPYMPQNADIWSAGIVLLEIAGGLTSLSRVVGYDHFSTEAADVANDILNFFGQPGSHSRALATMGAVENPEISEKLAMMLQPDPQNRTPMGELSGAVE